MYATIRRAIKVHRCDVTYAGVQHTIHPGQLYRRTVRFPDDINSSGRPWTYRVCADCADYVGKPIPGALSHARARLEHTLLVQMGPGLWTGPVQHDRRCACNPPALAILVAADPAVPGGGGQYTLHVQGRRHVLNTHGAGRDTAMDMAGIVLAERYDLHVYWEPDPHGRRYIARPAADVSPAVRDLLDQVTTIPS